MSDRLLNRDARRLFLDLHGLSEPVHRKLTDSELADRIERIGFVQIDSVNTVERAHHMILHARNRTYRPKQLAQLLEKDRALFENWTHDASAIPTKFYPYWRHRFRRNAVELRERWRKFRRPGFEQETESVLSRIAADGPVMARELGGEKPKDANGWWDWHPSKTALEYLWRTGALAVCHRKGFQKVYDLAERVIPEAHRDHEPDKAETIDWLCRAALGRLGFASAGEIANYWETVSNPEAQDWCRAQLGTGLREIEVECTDTEKPRTVYAFDDVTDRLEAAPGPLPVLRILSPFDPMIRDRQRAKRLFGFDYRIEIFVPAHKRQYGYYVFPILEGDRFVGRIDMKHRRQEDGSLHVTGLWPERGAKFGKARRQALDSALERMRRFCGAECVTFADGYFREGG